MANFDLDVFVIGTMPDSRPRGAHAAGHGVRVALAEEYRVDCIHIFDRDAAELSQLTAVAAHLGTTKH